MKELFIGIALAGLLGVSGAGFAQGKKKGDADHVKKDITDHRAMAEAHLNAAKCLESGKPEKECQTQLGKDCKGLAIGKYCGMRHRD